MKVWRKSGVNGTKSERIRALIRVVPPKAFRSLLRDECLRLLLCIGKSPAGLFKAIGQSMFGKAGKNGSWNFRTIGDTLMFSVPYVLCGLSMAFANRVGLFNIGAEGQYTIGMLAAHIVAVCVPAFPGHRKEKPDSRPPGRKRLSAGRR